MTKDGVGGPMVIATNASARQGAMLRLREVLEAAEEDRLTGGLVNKRSGHDSEGVHPEGSRR